MKFLPKVVKKNVWLGPLLFIKILKTAQQSPSILFRPPFTTCIFCSFFHGGKDISAIPQPSVHHLVYVSLIFFRFHKYFNYFHLSKNLLTNTFFH